VKTPRIAPAAAQHGGGVAARRQAHQDALLHAPHGGDAVRTEVRLKLPVHHIGGQHQGQFAQLAQLAGVRQPV